MLKKSTLREIKSSFGRYIAILAIMVIGVGVYSGMVMTQPDMIDTAIDFLDTNNLYDYEIMSSYGIDDDSVALAMKTDGVEVAESSIQKDVIVMAPTEDSEESVLKAISLPQYINTVKLATGRLPQKANECIIDNYTTVGVPYKAGDVITITDSNSEEDIKAFKYKKFTVVGTVNSPLYLDYQRGSTTLGNGTLETFFYISKDAFNVDYATHLYIKLAESGASFSDTKDQILKKNESSMEELARKITATRRAAARESGQKKLDEKIAEYNERLDEFNSQQASANRQIQSARKTINNAKGRQKDGLAEYSNQLEELKKNKSQVEAAINQLESQKALLEEQYQAETIPESTYSERIKEINTQLTEQKSNLSKINDGIVVVDAAKAEIVKSGKQLNKKESELNSKEQEWKATLTAARKELDKAKAELDKAQNQLDEMETGNSFALSRENNAGYSTFRESTDIVNSMSKIFPVFFLIVAMLVCITTMTRMIDDQRSQIGVLRAMGFKNSSIRKKYLFYSGSATLIGSVIGFFLGSELYPRAVWMAYTMMFDFDHSLNTHINYRLGLVATLVALLCSMGATWISCSNEFKDVPSSLIKPRTPPSGRHIFLEKLGFIWNRLDFMHKVSLRNVFRYRKRFLMMLLGISGCTALLVCALGIRTTISGIADVQFSEINKYDYQINFVNNMNRAKQHHFCKDAQDTVGEYGDMIFIQQNSADVFVENRMMELVLNVADKDVSNYVNFKYDGHEVSYPEDGEVLLCRKMEKQYGVRIGDEIRIKQGYRSMTAKVSGFYDNHIQEIMFMNKATYQKGMGVKPLLKTALVNAPSEMSSDDIRQQTTELSRHSDVSAIVVSDSIIDSVRSMMESLDVVVLMLILCAGSLSFLVLFNLTNINIIERVREIATIKVLGFMNRETSQYIFRENFIMTAFAVVIGMPMGKALLDSIINNIKVEMIFFLTKITLTDYAIAFVITFAFTLLINIILNPNIKKIRMVDALKTTE